MAAALHPATRRAAAAADGDGDGDDYGDLWSLWIAPRYRERRVAVERPRRVEAVEGRVGVGAMKPVGKEATADGEEGVEEIPEWVLRLTTRRDIRVGRARRAVHSKHAVKATTSLASCYLTPDTGNAPSSAAFNRRRQDRSQGKPGRMAAPGRPAKEYIFRNSFAVFMSEIEAGEMDAGEDMFQEGETFAEPERDTKLEPQRQTLEARIELAETEHRRARTLRQEWPAVVKFREMDSSGVEMFQDGQAFAEPERDGKFEPHALEIKQLADTEDHPARSPALVKDQAISPGGTKRDKGGNTNNHMEKTPVPLARCQGDFCTNPAKSKNIHEDKFFQEDAIKSTKLVDKVDSKELEEWPLLVRTLPSALERYKKQHGKGPSAVTAAGEQPPARPNPLLHSSREVRRGTQGGRGGGPGRDGGQGGGGGGGHGQGGGGGDGGGGGGGGGFPDEGPDEQALPLALCRGDGCLAVAKRYCSGCANIYCDTCSCRCHDSIASYKLPEPIVVGDCEIHHALSARFPDYPYVFVRGVRSLVKRTVEYTFASVHHIFQIEGLGPNIPVINCTMRIPGAWSWTIHRLMPIPGIESRSNLRM